MYVACSCTYNIVSHDRSLVVFVCTAALRGTAATSAVPVAAATYPTSGAGAYTSSPHVHAADSCTHSVHMHPSHDHCIPARWSLASDVVWLETLAATSVPSDVPSPSGGVLPARLAAARQAWLGTACGIQCVLRTVYSCVVQWIGVLSVTLSVAASVHVSGMGLARS